MFAADFFLWFLLQFFASLDAAIFIVVVFRRRFRVHTDNLSLQSLVSALDLDSGLFFFVNLHKNSFFVSNDLAQIPRSLCHVLLSILVEYLKFIQQLSLACHQRCLVFELDAQFLKLLGIHLRLVIDLCL